MSHKLAESEEGRQRLAAIQVGLAIYAGASIVLQPVPEGSLERLMARVEREKSNLYFADGRRRTKILWQRAPARSGRVPSMDWLGACGKPRGDNWEASHALASCLLERARAPARGSLGGPQHSSFT